jgi:hypothetical protein
MPKRASKRASKRRKSKQIKKRRNTNKKRFFGGALDANLIINSWSSKLYDDIHVEERQPHNPVVSRRNARFFNVMKNYTPALEMLRRTDPSSEKIKMLESFDNELIKLLKGNDTVDDIKTKIDEYFGVDYSGTSASLVRSATQDDKKPLEWKPDGTRVPEDET